MKTISITLYRFEELGRQQQDKALEEFRYINVMDQDWFEFTKDDFLQNLQNPGNSYRAGKYFIPGFLFSR